MNSVNMDIINDIFREHSDKKIWCATLKFNKESTKENKAPYDPVKKCFMEWSDEDNLLTLEELNEYVPHKYPGCGFITGIRVDDINGIPYPNLQCLDFDDVLENGEIINPEIEKLVVELNTYTEISAGGDGLHAVIYTDFDEPEWSFDDEKYCKGKYYSKNHFIKLTGALFDEYTPRIRYFKASKIHNLKKIIGKISVMPNIKPSAQSTFNYQFKSWSKTLTENGIPWEDSDYTNKIREYKDENGVIAGKKLCLEGLKIECPNKDKHTQIENPDKSAHKAILCLWEDGTTSLKCNHNACAPEKRPNLLQMLWDQIRYKEKYNKMKDAGLL